MFRERRLMRSRRNLGALALLLAICAVTCVAQAVVPQRADAAPRTDVLLLFDTTGSMSSALSTAVKEVHGVTSRVDGALGDVAYGVAEVRDYGDDYPYRVVQSITSSRAHLAAGLGALEASGGGDPPEAYGRALRDADEGAGLGWRLGARRMVILVADNVPHDDDLNLWIPPEEQTFPSPFNTGLDPGTDTIVGTADDIDWQPLLTRLAHNGLPLMYVLFKGNPDLLPYWRIWAGITGGTAVEAGVDDLADALVDVAKRGAAAVLPPCPAGYERGSDRRCRPIGGSKPKSKVKIRSKRKRVAWRVRRCNRPAAWPQRRSAWTVVLASERTRAAAVRVARRACGAGLTQTGVLSSSDYTSLRRGYWVAYTGVLGRRAAARRQKQARALLFKDAYARYVSRPR